MNYNRLKAWMGQKLNMNPRLKKVTILYVMFLMISCRKHSLEEAARFSCSTKARFSKFLKKHSDLAVVKLDELSKRQAKQFGKNIRFIAKGECPWKIAVMIDATLQKRSSLHVENAKRFNHGKGFVIGHQWTNIVIFFNDVLIPLPPIAFYTKAYCRKNNMKYMTEQDHVVEYIKKLDISEYVDSHDPRDVVVLADSGYDNKKIEKAVASKGWKYVIALKKKRSVKTEKEYAETPKSKDWQQIESLFKKHRRVKWVTVSLGKNSPKKKRKEFRVRQITGYLRHVGKAQLICSEFKKRPKGRRKYLACNDMKANPQQILSAYRVRWEIEIFHKKIKMFLGFESVATTSFKSVVSHVHWVYCAYILLNFKMPGMNERITSIGKNQIIIEESIRRKKIAHISQVLSQINGLEKLKNEIRRALTDPIASQTLI
jgi:hypothetical protein